MLAEGNKMTAVVELIGANIAFVREKICAAAGRVARDPKSIELLAVTKKVPLEQMVHAYRAGQVLFGENYVQEAAGKIEALKASLSRDNLGSGADLRFDFIGKLQRNKVRKAVSLFNRIQTVHSYEVVQEISHEAQRLERCQPILMQVNISRESSKSGVMPEEVLGLAKKILPLAGVKLRGLMSIGSWDEGDEARKRQRREFREMFELRSKWRQKLELSCRIYPWG